MVGKDGKLREIQAANTAGILRLIQSIPSPKAEPFKLWMTQHLLYCFSLYNRLYFKIRSTDKHFT